MAAEEGRDKDKTPTKQHKQCLKWKGNILKYDNVMNFMTHHLEKIGCNMTSKYFICKPCDSAVGGYFDPDEGVILCENHLQNEEHAANTMIHESIHAYDHCRVEMNWNDCRQHACSEIRASSLSGDCGIMNEFYRGYLKSFPKHHQECVRRRALKSISMNPACAGIEEKTLDEVFEMCFKDTEPFDEIY